MKIQLLSDLHLEAHPHFDPQPAPGADVLVLAGDIGSYQAGSQLTDEDFGLARFSPLPRGAGWPTPVIFVPGNHEYDAQDFDAAHARLRQTCDRLGICWLERECVELAGVRPELQQLATAGKKAITRELGFVALVAADGTIEDAWRTGAKSVAALQDLVAAMPLVRDPGQRAALYPKVEALLGGLPPELAKTVGDVKTVKGRYVRVELPGKQRTLTLAEVEVMSDGKNVALTPRSSSAGRPISTSEAYPSSKLMVTSSRAATRSRIRWNSPVGVQYSCSPDVSRGGTAPIPWKHR